MGGGGKSTTNTVAEPPKFIQPYLQDAAQRSFDLFRQGGRQYFPNSTVVPFSPQTQRALDLTQQRATQGGAATNAAQGYVADTLGGGGVRSNRFLGASDNPFRNSDPNNPFLNNDKVNPFLDDTFNRAADSVQQRLQSSFAGSGRNISAGRPVAADELGDLASRIYGGAYESDAARRQQAYEGDVARRFSAYEADTGRKFQAFDDERRRQDFAAGLAPQLDESDYRDLAALQGVGAQYEDLYGRQLEDQINRFEFEQNRPYQNLDEYIARIQGGYPGGQTSASMNQPRPNRLAGAAGGALTGYQVSGNPIGAGVGALAGYFLS